MRPGRDSQPRSPSLLPPGMDLRAPRHIPDRRQEPRFVFPPAAHFGYDSPMPRTRRIQKFVDRVRASYERHEERHRPSGFDVVVADDFRAFPPGAWEQVTAGASFFLGRPYLTALAQTAPANVRPRYAMLLRGTEPAAAIAVQLVDTALADWKPVRPSTGNTGIFTRLRRQAVSHVPTGMLVCGNLFSWGPHGVAAAPGEDADGIWSGVAEALRGIARAEGSGRRPDFILVKDLPGEAIGDDATLRRHQFQCHDTEPDMVLDLSPAWRSYSDYLDSLNTKYRKAARKISKDVEAAGIRWERPVDLEPIADELQTLYRQVQSRAPQRPVAITPGYLPAIARAAGESFQCSVLRRDGEMVGFVTLIQDGETAVGYFLGMDYKTNETIPIYFRLLLEAVEQAIRRGCRRLSFGRTALEPKARLGARPSPLRVWVRHRHSLVNLAVRRIVQDLPHDEAPDRNPFKSAPDGGAGAKPDPPPPATASGTRRTTRRPAREKP